MMKFKAYKTNLGLFIEPSGSCYGSHRLNGDIPIQAGWNHLKDVFEITSYETLQAGSTVTTGYILKISSVANEEIPLNLSAEEVNAHWDDDEEETVWDSYNDYRALYKPVTQTLPAEWKAQPFEVEIVREIQIDNYEEPLKMVIGAHVRKQEPNWQTSNVLADVVLYEDIERILTPEFLLHERPCQLAPAQLYSVIRNHIKTNINPKAAYVSSDYDFCFSVKKRITIKPVTIKTEIKKQNGRSYASPKFSTKQFNSKDEILFEMAPKAYQSYPVLEHWHATNLKEMAAQLKYYLDTLMEEINAEVEECPHCKGVGVIVNKIGANDRSAV